MGLLDVTRVVVGIAGVVLALLSLRGAQWPYTRWAYAGWIVSALLYFPLRTGFVMSPRPCALAFTWTLALLSLQNYAHIVLFACFFLVSRRQFHGPRAALWAGVATLAMGALVELAQGVTGNGNCRARDLVPDTAGAILGSLASAGARGLRGSWPRRAGMTDGSRSR